MEARFGEALRQRAPDETARAGDKYAHHVCFREKRISSQPTMTRAGDKRRDLGDRSIEPHAQRGKRDQHDVHREDMRDDLRDGKAVVGRALVEMRAMRLPDPFARVTGGGTG